MSPNDSHRTRAGRPAGSIRAARRARVRMIRSRVIGITVALFVLVWSVIAVRLVTGHDPALAKHAVAAVPSGQASSASPNVSSEDDSGGGLSGGSSTSTSGFSTGSSSSTGGSSSSVSPITSSQS